MQMPLNIDFQLHALLYRYLITLLITVLVFFKGKNTKPNTFDNDFFIFFLFHFS